MLEAQLMHIENCHEYFFCGTFLSIGDGANASGSELEGETTQIKIKIFEYS